MPAAATSLAVATGSGTIALVSAKNLGLSLQKLEFNSGNSNETIDSGNWNKGSYDSPKTSLEKHYNKHKDEVGAKSIEQYLRKAQEFARTAKKGSTKSIVSGHTQGVIRYKKNGKYIDLAPDGSIVSFGSTGGK